MDFGKSEIYIRILIPALMIYAMAALFITGGRVQQAQRQLEAAQEYAQQTQEENRQLQEDIDRAEDPRFLEEMIGRRLGLVMPEDGERSSREESRQERENK